MELSLSVIVCTKNRPGNINKCLKSIISSTNIKFEVVVIDQSANCDTENIVNKIEYKNIKYIRSLETGLSRARNLGLKVANGKIIVFTDDDCIVDRNWINNINKHFTNNKQTVCVFGKVLPYYKTFITGCICPSITTRNDSYSTSEPCVVWERLGGGNNMAFTKKSINNIGGFRNWLGVGSYGCSGEEQDLVLRLLLKKQKVDYVPSIKVWHDRWIKPKEKIILDNKYIVGAYAVYSYYKCGGLIVDDFSYLHIYIHNILSNLYVLIRNCIRYRKLNLQEWLEIMSDIFILRFIIKGYVIGYSHYLWDKVYHSKIVINFRNT